MSDNTPPAEVDVAIVGGGISGIYSGWRLLSDGVGGSPLLRKWAGPDGRLKVAVFEGSRRIGGRLLSARPPGMPHITCEMGGMRYVSSQALIRNLVENVLKLPRREQVVDEPQNVAYVRGKHLRLRQVGDPSALPYGLRPAEAQWLAGGRSPAELIGWAMNQVVPGLSDPNLHGDALREFLRAAHVDGSPLYQHGFWNLLARALSNEAYQLCRTLVGYDALGANANAVDLTAEYYDFTPDVKYYLIDGGYDLVPWTLERQFRDQGGQVVLDAWLDHFDAVTLADGTTGVALTFGDGTRVHARSIILAMPRRSIELLRPTGPVLDPKRAPHVQYLLNSVEPVPLYKLCISYPNPWWESFGVKQGRSLTDGPVRQCYYWGVEGQQPGGDKRNRNAVIMAYNDETSVSYWGGLRRRPLTAEDSMAATSRARRTPPAHHDARGTAFQRKPVPHAAPAADAPQDEYARRLRQNWDDHKAPRRHGRRDAPSTGPHARRRVRPGADRRGLRRLVGRPLRRRRPLLEPRLPVVARPEGHGPARGRLPVLRLRRGVLDQPDLGRGGPPDRRARARQVRPGEAILGELMSSARPRIVGLGYQVPAQIRTNDDPIFDWIKANPPPGADLFKGYDQRRVLVDDLASIMAPASAKALAAARLDPSAVDLLLGWASFGPNLTPNEVCRLHHELGLPERSWVIPLGNDYTNFNAGLLFADGLLRAGGVRTALVAIGCDWTRHVSYHTPQSVSASDGAASAVMAMSDDPDAWEVIDHQTVTRSKYYGTMFMRGDRVDRDPTPDGPAHLWTDPYFQITAEGMVGFHELGVDTPASVVLAMLGRHGLTGADVTLISHQTSTVLMDAWAAAIKPAQFVNTIGSFANMTGASIPVTMAWAGENQPVEKSHLVLLGLGPDMHVNALLLRRGVP